MSTKDKYLYYLDELSDYKISHKDQDVRGWDIKDRDNRVVGKVDNLLVNKNLEKVVYLDVEVDSSIIEANHDPYGKPANPDVREFINKKGENHIIVPVGMVTIHHDPDYVFTESINYQTFAETKRYETGTPVNREYEENVLNSYNRERKLPHDTPKRVEEERVVEERHEKRKLPHEAPHERLERDEVVENRFEKGAAEAEAERRHTEERHRQRTADEIDYDRRKDDPDYREQETRYSESIPDENYDEDYERRRQKREAEDFREKQAPLGEKEGRRKTDWNPEAPYNKETEDRSAEERIPEEHHKKSQIPDDDSFYKRREFDDRNFRRKK